MPRLRLRHLVATVLLAWAIAAVALAWSAWGSMRQGVDTLEAARAEFELDTLADGAAAKTLLDAHGSFDHAHRAASNPVLFPARHLPVVGRQLRSAIALSRAAAEVTTTGQVAVEEATELLAAGSVDSASRARLLRRLSDVAERARTDLDGIDLGPDDALIAPMAHRRAMFNLRLGQALGALRRLEASTAAVADLLDGPSRYLLLAANNGEMRNGSGMALSAGVLVGDGGELKIGQLVRTGDLALDGRTAPPLDAAVETHWGWLNPNREWRNLGMTPRFEATAALAADMWESRTGEKLDGVLLLDVAAVEAAVRATGPVEIDGVRVDARNVRRVLLREQYEEYGDELDGREQAERRDMLSDIASMALEKIQSADVPVERVAMQLARAAAGRHILAWSRHPHQQEGWRAAGVAGHLTGDSLLVGVANRGGNKLDQFLDVEARLTITPRAGLSEAVLSLNIHNNAPEGGSRYVLGPHPASGVAEGEYVGILSISLPGAARGARFDGGLPLAAAGEDGPSRILATELRVARGAAIDVVARFSLPGESGAILVEPSARIPAIEWHHGGEEWRDRRARVVRW